MLEGIFSWNRRGAVTDGSYIPPRCPSDKLYLSMGIAAVLWFVMFNPWLGLNYWFWSLMAASSVILLLLTFDYGSLKLAFDWKQIGLGVALAAVLWGIFWVGDHISALIFSFSDTQVGNIYAMGDGRSAGILAAQLLILTGPAEEMFWRGFVQEQLGQRTGRFTAMLLTLAVYTLIHIWSFNFMLIMAALVAGAVWGLLYWLRPQWLPALVISHALWDAAVFVIFPI
ncbi:MAG: CPBP family intramembrane metalloprotease [Bacteroidales bacterium]|nr:CPBP family intramembrane metalloprotease [Bacteroidales bacterium]